VGKRTKAHIKKITVYLGDQQVAAVVRGKISKKNLEAKTNTFMEIA
jgi:V/A-type H+-transporting ATPase subunit D